MRGVSLEVREGEVVGLLGPNGAGKTTFLEILSTLLLPNGGEASVCGHDVVNDAAQVRRMVGYCPSGPDSFYPRLSGAANLEFFALLSGLAPSQARMRIAALLDALNIDGATNRAFQRCSEGIKQRFALARVLLNHPRVLLLDEPTRSLDPLLQREIRRLLRETLLNQQVKAVLLVTHSLEEAEQVCDRLAILHQGRMVSVGTPAEIRRTMGEAELAAAFQKAVGAC